MKLKQYLIEQKDKEVIFLIGLPGSGKSTYIDKYLKEYTVVSNDHIIEKYADQKGITYTEAFKELDVKDVNSKFKANLHKAIKSSSKIIIDNTNLSKSRRHKVLSQFDDSWKKIALVFNVSRKELMKRLDKRAKETGKHIPEKVIDDMIKTYQNPTKDEFDVIKNV